MDLSKITIILISFGPYIVHIIINLSIQDYYNSITPISLLLETPFYICIEILIIYGLIFRKRLLNSIIIKIETSKKSEYFKMEKMEIFYLGRIIINDVKKEKINDRTIHRIKINFIYFPIFLFFVLIILFIVGDFLIKIKVINIIIFTIYTSLMIGSGLYQINKYKNIEKNYDWIFNVVKKLDC
jgi:hypothetical protein